MVVVFLSCSNQMRKKKGLKGEATGTISVQNRAGNEDINSRGGGGGEAVCGLSPA